MSNRFAALAVDDEPAAAPTAAPQQRAPRAYVPPNMRRNQAQQAPTTQSRLTAPPNISAKSEFPSLGARHMPAAAKPVAAAAAGAGWASKARDWANYDETAEAVERERKRKEQEKASMITLSRPAFRAPPKPLLSPGTSEFHNTTTRYPRYPLQSTNEEDNDEVDAAEAYVGGYDQSRYSADYAEPADDEDEGEYNDGRYTPPYPPYPY